VFFSVKTTETCATSGGDLGGVVLLNLLIICEICCEPLFLYCVYLTMGSNLAHNVSGDWHWLYM